ncbi:MAG: glycerate kinase, partial [Spirochaetales bacterium]|nr:glycerate kinase [Spirochaetales bacterium]
MKILIAPDSFKGSATSRMAAEAIGKGVHLVFPDA